MEYRFTKLSGAGNDFILFDGINYKVPALTPKLIQELCVRGLGIGADGILVVEPSAKYDYELFYFNSDGSSGMLCANGARSSLIYAKQNLSVESKQILFECCGKEYSGVVTDEDEAVFYLPDLSAGEKISIELNGKSLPLYSAHSGAPQVVADFHELKSLGLVENASFDNFLFVDLARQIRYHKAFAPEGVNVNVISDESGRIKIRSFERGIEGETLACGTGIIASAMFLSEIKDAAVPIEIISKSGKKFIINFRKNLANFESVSLRGHAQIIFNGYINLRSINE